MWNGFCVGSIFSSIGKVVLQWDGSFALKQKVETTFFAKLLIGLDESFSSVAQLSLYIERKFPRGTLSAYSTAAVDDDTIERAVADLWRMQAIIDRDTLGFDVLADDVHED